MLPHNLNTSHNTLHLLGSPTVFVSDNYNGGDQLVFEEAKRSLETCDSDFPRNFVAFYVFEEMHYLSLEMQLCFSLVFISINLSSKLKCGYYLNNQDMNCQKKSHSNLRK